MDIKDIRSLFTSLGFILFYVFATAGIVKLLWNTDDYSRFEGRVKFLILFQILFFLIYIIGIYHIVGPRYTAPFYETYVWAQFIYVVIGLISYILLKRKQ